MMKVKKIGLVVLASMILVSCFKDSEVALDVNTDVYMIKKMAGDVPVFGVAFYAYGNQIMKSGTVTQVGGLGEQINLGLNPGSIYTLYKEPSEDEFYGYLPTASEYKFSVLSESGQSQVSSDFLNVKNIGVPFILKAEIGDVQKLFDITWTKVTNADGYVVKIAEENGNYIYSTGAVSSETTTVSINLLVGNWTKPIEQGNAYVVEVSAFAYEDNVDSYTAAYNLETISIASKTVIYE